MQKPRKLTPRPRIFDSLGSKNKPVELRLRWCRLTMNNRSRSESAKLHPKPSDKPLRMKAAAGKARQFVVVTVNAFFFSLARVLLEGA
jgi:hypothetical protein